MLKPLVRLSGISLFVFTIILGGFPSVTYGQTETKAEGDEPADLRIDRFYQRIAVVPLFVNLGNLKEADYALLNPKDPPVRFDKHTIESKVIRSNFTRNDYLIPAPAGSSSTTPSIDYKKRIALLQDLFHEQKIGNQILSAWFDRNDQGQFTVFGTFEKRAEYSAAIEDWLKALATVRGERAITDHADQLVNNTYLLAVDISKVSYFKKDSEENPGTYTEGYNGTGDIHVFKLDFGDSVQNIFWNQWVDVNEDPAANQSKIDAFNAQRYPLSYVETISISNSSQQTIYPKKTGNSLVDKVIKSRKKKTKAELYNNCIKGLSGNIGSVFLSRTSVDCSIRTNIIGTAPIAGRIGKKEGVKAEHTFYIMEDQQKKNGITLSKRVGAARILYVGKNQGDGMQTDSSTFYQIAGAKPGEGMFLLEKTETGVNLGFAIERGLSGGMSGPAIKAEFNLARGGLLPRGILLYMTAAFDGSKGTRLPFESEKSFTASNDDYTITYRQEEGPNDENFFRLAFGVMYEKYFMRNFHINANLGYGFESMSNASEEIDNVSINQGLLDLGSRLGVSITPNLQFEVGLNLRRAVGEAAFSFSQESESDPEETESIRIPLEGVSYGELFPGRDTGVSASFGLRFLL